MRFARLVNLESKRLTDDQSRWIYKNFHKNEWDSIIFEIADQAKFNRHTISPEAVTLSMKVFKEFDILLFPVAHRVTSPTKDVGVASWYMIDIKHSDWWSADTLRRFSNKKIYLSMDWKEREITTSQKK